GVPQTRRNLALACAKLGDVALLLGDRPAARRYYDESLKLRLVLAEDESAGENARVDLAQGDVKLGNVSEPDEARYHYQKALRLREALVKAAPRRAPLWRDLWIAHLKLTELALRVNDPKTARKHGQECLRVAGLLVKGVPKNRRFKQDLA